MDLLQRFASAWCGTAEAGDTHLVSAVTGWIVIPRWLGATCHHLSARWRVLGPTALLVLLAPNLSSKKRVPTINGM